MMRFDGTFDILFSSEYCVTRYDDVDDHDHNHNS